ncbi:MAG: pyruvate/2-oxoglutarate dehydrogenase complex, dihydrolipoamide acyltransferase component [Symbiobacteriaceae bacterium]|jgi:pyruvate dehydrogenase E2 component (dihydrolipoamide acetyltransferase)|nr:pyruvate/2-oxoglutarate dehydrogenase complex, dihydrolipoamide acyltransferase component [Symbiobacteriaceae bacterium]
MAIEFKLPDVGEGLHEAELLKWMVNEGDYVREDQPIMEVQTDKAAVEITSPVTAKVAKLIGKVGDILHVHSVVVVFDDGKAAGLPAQDKAEAAVAAAAPAGAEPKAQADVVAAAAAAAPLTVIAGGGAGVGGKALASPATRKLARELGVDINQVPGSGPAGRVTSGDVRNFKAGKTAVPTPAAAVGAPAPTAPATEAGPAAPAAATTQVAAAARGVANAVAPIAGDERLPLKGIRKVISERMAKSVYTAPHVTVVDEVDMSALSEFRGKAKELAAKKGIKLSFMPFIFKALTTALKEHPYLNAQIDDEKQEIVLRKQYHMGFALDTEAGLLVPVVKDVDKKSVFQIAAEMQDLIERGKAGKLAPDELKGSTFTISNQGSVGGLFFTPVINYPEVAILGVGSTVDRPVVRDGQVTVAPMMYLALSFDHRLIDGAPASRFLNRVIELLTNPTLLMMEAM